MLAGSDHNGPVGREHGSGKTPSIAGPCVHSSRFMSSELFGESKFGKTAKAETLNHQTPTLCFLRPFEC